MFQTIRNHTEGEGLDLRPGFSLGLTICEDPSQTNYFRDPAPVFFLLNFNFERYGISTFVRVNLFVHFLVFHGQPAQMTRLIL